MKSVRQFTLYLLTFLILVFTNLVIIHAQESKTTLTIGTTYIIDTLNPTTSLYSYNLKGLFYETLIEATDGANVEPGLAESWSVSDDGLVWTFKIVQM
ncbi:MAG: hypothetical protein R3E39_03465 [Anaerolineae bacterium]